jgi:hypothetical protein
MWYIHIILSNTKAGRGAFNHIFLPNIGVGACALSGLAYFVYDNLFICIDLWSYITVISFHCKIGNYSLPAGHAQLLRLPVDPDWLQLQRPITCRQERYFVWSHHGVACVRHVPICVLVRPNSGASNRYANFIDRFELATDF